MLTEEIYHGINFAVLMPYLQLLLGLVLSIFFLKSLPHTKKGKFCFRLTKPLIAAMRTNQQTKKSCLVSSSKLKLYLELQELGKSFVLFCAVLTDA